MKNRMRMGFLLFLFVTATCYSQVKKEYSFPGLYNQKSAQGMAIHNHSAFLLSDKGYCRIYDLKKNQLISEFDLASAGENNHANCASFGVEFPRGNEKYPALYVSECRGAFRCFVESIDENGSQLIQTLQLETKGIEHYSANWIVDKEQKCIYTISCDDKEIDSLGTKKHLMTKLPLPSLGSTTVIFTEKDILEQFEIDFPNMVQGGIIHKNYLYLPVGLDKSPLYTARKDAKREIIVVDLKKKQIEKIIDIDNDVPEEPEDVDFYKGKLLLYCGQNGGLYKISTKK